MLIKGRLKKFVVKILFSLMLISFSCSDEPYSPVEFSPVNYNLNEMPYDNLSQYNFFEGEMKNLTPVYGVIPYELITISLFAYNDFGLSMQPKSSKIQSKIYYNCNNFSASIFD